MVAGACAQQTNSYDCGMYVLQFSEIIVDAFLASGGNALDDDAIPTWERRLRQVRSSDITNKRRFYHQLFSQPASVAVGLY